MHQNRGEAKLGLLVKVVLYIGIYELVILVIFGSHE